MTNGWIDIRNADVILIMGGNPAENHPCGFKWVIEAKRDRSAKVIVVDPRFTRTAANAELFLQIRAGSDIAFLGGLINYAIQNGRIAHEYVVNYTNAPFVISDEFKLPEDGLFSGFDPATGNYEKSTWNYRPAGGLEPPPPPEDAVPVAGDSSSVATAARLAPTAPAVEPASTLPSQVAYDISLQHPRCVFQLLKKHYSRYTPETVERITGIRKDDFLKAADLFTSVRKEGETKKVSTIVYAVGWTQHSFGTQIIRAAAILQLLLGNVGRSGGGVNALRGHSNIQGATDIGGVFDLLPGYLKVPISDDRTLDDYLKRVTPTVSRPFDWNSWNYFSNTPRFMVSLLKALYGDAATSANGWAFDFLPKIDRNYSWVELFDRMYQGEVKGLFAFGMNAVMIGPNTRKNIEALKRADWLVVCELFPDETSEFWRAPGTSREEMSKINTTVYRLPGAGFAEKDGTFVNSARWLQWKYAAVSPPGDARVDQEILARIFLKVRELYQTEGGKFPAPILSVNWQYSNPSNPPLAEVARELNGRALADIRDETTGVIIKAGLQLSGFGLLRDDGSTLCGNWLYCGSWTEAGAQSQRRGTEDFSGLGLYPNWAWSWPANRRVMYNRASCDLSGKSWDSERLLVRWDPTIRRWVGNDVPDFKPDSPPEEHMGPFIMNPEGVGRLFAPLGALADGPFPEHYEPLESPIRNPLHPNQSTNPVVHRFSTPLDKYVTQQQEFTIVCTTYRLTEHYHYWTKNNPMEVELVPEPFVEVPLELARELGIRGGQQVRVTSARGQYVAKAMVTRRIRPMMIDGRKIYQIGIPIHWGYRGIAEDQGKTALNPANLLSPTSIDPNAFTPEYKSFLVQLQKV